MDLTSLPPPIWVARPSALQQMVHELSNSPILAVDTESNSLYAYQEQVCLIQFSTTETDYLVDPLAISDLSSLGPIFANPNIEKVFHAAEYDVICLKRDFGFQFTNLFDTMVAARILGRKAVGLGSILKEEYNIEVDKRYQRANWGQRPLPPELLSYARFDSRFLIGLRNRMRELLLSGSLWPLAEEDFSRLCQINGHSNGNGMENACWRINGVQDLAPQQIAILQELCCYRDEQAHQANRPAFKIMSNQSLIDIAQAAPRTQDALQRIRSLSGTQLHRHANNLLRAVERGLKNPPPVRPVIERPDELMILRVDGLRAWRRQMGLKLGVESDVVLPRDILMIIAENNPTDIAGLKTLMLDVPWRYKRYGEEIMRVLNQYRRKTL